MVELAKNGCFKFKPIPCVVPEFRFYKRVKGNVHRNSYQQDENSIVNQEVRERHQAQRKRWKFLNSQVCKELNELRNDERTEENDDAYSGKGNDTRISHR